MERSVLIIEENFQIRKLAKLYWESEFPFYVQAQEVVNGKEAMKFLEKLAKSGGRLEMIFAGDAELVDFDRLCRWINQNPDCAGSAKIFVSQCIPGPDFSKKERTNFEVLPKFIFLARAQERAAGLFRDALMPYMGEEFQTKKGA